MLAHLKSVCSVGRSIEMKTHTNEIEIGAFEKLYISLSRKKGELGFYLHLIKLKLKKFCFFMDLKTTFFLFST